MSLDNLSFRIIADELSQEMTNANIGKPFALSEHDFSLPYTEFLPDGSRRFGSFVFSMDPTNPFATYSKERFEKAELNTPFFNSLKKLTNGRVTSVKKYQGERILTISIEASKLDITEINSSYDFILEMFPNRPNAYIIAYPYGKIVSVYKEHTDIEKGIFITRNAEYVYPDKKDDLPRHLNECEEARPYLPNMTLRKLKDYVENKGNDLDETLEKMIDSRSLFVINKDILSFGFSNPDAKEVRPCDLYSFFVKDQKSLAKMQKISELLSLINKSIKTAKKKLANLHIDLQNAKDRMICMEYGQMIYLYQGEISKGDTVLERDGYVIPLDPRLDAPHNANAYFRKYTKAKSAQTILADLIGKTEDEITYLEKKLVEANDGTPRDIMELKSELLETGYIKVKQGRNSVYKVSKKYKYVPHYICIPEGKIGFGMNGLQNEELTFNIAKKDDLFLHVKDYPGSHVVILEGKENEETRTLAAELACYLSHLDSGIVMIAKKKDVKKNPEKIGLVNILKYETVAVRFIRPESISLFRKTLKN